MKRGGWLRKAIKKALDEYFVFTMLVAALIIITTMITAHFVTFKPERFTAIGLLNENGETGPYPANISYNEPLNITLEVINQEGRVELYKINTYIGDGSTYIDPENGTMNATKLSSMSRYVNSGSFWAQNISLSFNETLVGFKKILFELWMFNVTSSEYYFTGQTVHIWIDILGP